MVLKPLPQNRKTIPAPWGWGGVLSLTGANPLREIRHILKILFAFKYIAHLSTDSEGISKVSKTALSAMFEK
jgi:hypothetical protein